MACPDTDGDDIDADSPLWSVFGFECGFGFGGWVGRFLPQFFIYRCIATGHPTPRLIDRPFLRTR